MLHWRFLLAVLIVGVLAGLCWLDAQAALPGPGSCRRPSSYSDRHRRGVDLARQAGMAPPAGIVQAANLLLVLAPWALCSCRRCPTLRGLSRAGPWAGGTLALWIVAAALLLVFLDQMRRYRKPGGITANLSAATFVMVYVG